MSMMKTKIDFSIFLLLILFTTSCKKQYPYRPDNYQPGSTTNSTTPVRKDTCTHGRQYYLNFNVDNTSIVCDTGLWAGSYFESDIQMNGNFSDGYIYLIAFISSGIFPAEYPINFWNSIELHLNGQAYYAGREYNEIIGSGTIRMQGITDECVKGSFDCKTGNSSYYGTSNIKTIKDGVFHLKRS